MHNFLINFYLTHVIQLNQTDANCRLAVWPGPFQFHLLSRVPKIPSVFPNPSLPIPFLQHSLKDPFKRFPTRYRLSTLRTNTSELIPFSLSFLFSALYPLRANFLTMSFLSFFLIIIFSLLSFSVSQFPPPRGNNWCFVFSFLCKETVFWKNLCGFCRYFN